MLKSTIPWAGTTAGIAGNDGTNPNPATVSTESVDGEAEMLRRRKRAVSGFVRVE